MTTNIPNVNTQMVGEILEMIYEYLDFSIVYFNYYKNNMWVLEYLEKNPELFLIDEKCAVVASLFEVMHTLKRVCGFDERINFFFKVSL